MARAPDGFEFQGKIQFDQKPRKGDHDQEVFIANMASNEESLAVCGNGFIKLYDLNTLEPVAWWGACHSSVRQMSFSLRDPNLLCSCALNGKIVTYDTRQRSAACTIVAPRREPMYSMACTGREVFGGGKKNIYSWDLRSEKPLRVLEEMHSDIVTKMDFHEGLGECTLFSASEDALVNQYDLSSRDPEEALHTVFMCDEPVWNFGFGGPTSEFLYALTNNDSLYLHLPFSPSLDDNSLLGSFDSECLQHHSLVDCFQDMHSNKFHLVSCSNEGDLFLSCIVFDQIVPSQHFSECHSARVRSLCYLPTQKVLVTGGEDNLMCVFRHTNGTVSNPPTEESAAVEAFLQEDGDVDMTS